MRPVNIGQPVGGRIEDRLRWIENALVDIANASRTELPGVIPQSYEATTTNERRSIDAGTISHADLAEVVATLVGDLRKGGAKRT